MRCQKGYDGRNCSTNIYLVPQYGLVCIVLYRRMLFLTEQIAVLVGSLLRHFSPSKALGSGERLAFWGTVLCTFDIRDFLILCLI